MFGSALMHARPAAGLARISLPRFIILATSVCLFVGLGSLLAWLKTGRVECARAFFVGPGALYLVFLGALEFSLCRIVVRQFSEGESLRPAWFLIMLSAGCHLVSAVTMQILSVPSLLNPLARGISAETAANLYRFGLLAGGPVQMVLLAGGLGWMLRLARQRGILPRIHLSDSFPLAVAGLVTYLQLSDLASLALSGSDPALYDLMAASTGPLYILLLVEASLVKSCMSAAGGGMIAKCWNSFAAAIFLSALSSLGMWLDSHGLLAAQPATISCFLGFFAATAYAVGPAWQIVAIQSACGGIGVPRFSPVATSLSALRLLNTARTH
jgi:hypothetical protein